MLFIKEDENWFHLFENDSVFGGFLVFLANQTKQDKHTSIN
jgi:hypothetical protein